MQQKTALILNDTSSAYHWGCFGTSMDIQTTLSERGYAVSMVSVVDIHGLKTPPRTETDLTDAGFRSRFLANNPALEKAMSAADVVVVNGEGTLHGMGQPAFNLLYVSNMAKSVFEKPVHAINMSLFPDDHESPDENVARLYTKMLGPLDHIVLREPRSFAIASQLGLNAASGFDCLPRYLKRMNYAPLAVNDGPIVLGGGLGLEPKKFGQIGREITGISNTRPLHYVTGAKDHPALDDAKVLDALAAAVPALTHSSAETFEDWTNMIAGAACLVSGRFHHTIAAAFLGTPVVTFRAGTPKLEGLCQALGYEPPLTFSDSDCVEQAINRVQRALSGNGVVLAADIKSRLMEAADRNFDGL
jgi:polysaccharide pyruvyl transferase WcaK-like protein